MARERPKPYFSAKVQTLLGSEQGVDIDSLAETLSDIAQQLDTAAVTPNIVPVPQAVNQLLNSSFLHSVESWTNSGAADDTRYECAWWFSNDPGEGVAMDPTTNPAVDNATLKEDTHGAYDAAYSDWYWTTGVGRFQGETTIDAQVLGNPVEPSYNGAVTAQLVRANQYVYINSDTRLSCGLYGNSTAEGWSYIFGAFELETEVLGTVATPTSRDYRIHARTSRGFSIISDITNVASAPSDADFNAGAIVNITWKPALNYGVLGYDVYRLTGATYKLLFRVVSGQTQYQDNGSFLADVVTGWPSADFDHLVAYTATNEGALSTVPYSGDPLNPQWATVPFVIRVPQNYDKSDSILADFQWLRFGLFGQNANGNLDLRVTDGVSDVDETTITSAAAQFSAGNAGQPVTITGKGLTDYAGTVDTYVSATEITVTPNYDITGGAPENLTVTIEGGAPAHSLWIKNVALSNTEGAAWAANPADYDGTHGIPPVTTNGSTQGGSGGGGGGNDGGPLCLFEEEWVKTLDGKVLVKDLEQFDWIDDGCGGRTQITDIKDGRGDVFYALTESGASIKCTDSHQLFITQQKEVPLTTLKAGDSLIVNGVPDQIKAIYKVFTNVRVRQLSLSPRPSFLAGTGGWVLTHNEKPIDSPVS